MGIIALSFTGCFFGITGLRKKALLLSDMKENEILKLLGLTEKQMRGIRAYRKLPEERLDTVMSILIEAMNRTKISFGNERNLFIQTMAKLIIL